MNDKTAAPYYYASGERVALEPDADHVALDLGTAPARSRSKTATAMPRAELQQRGRMLNDSVLLVTGAAPAGHASLQLPVFRSGSTLLVALPEVRVEDDDPESLRRLHAWLAAEPGRADVTDQVPGRITLRAGPVYGHDGVTLAREVVERCGVQSASPRLLRVTPGPKR